MGIVKKIKMYLTHYLLYLLYLLYSFKALFSTVRSNKCNENVENVDCTHYFKVVKCPFEVHYEMQFMKCVPRLIIVPLWFRECKFNPVEKQRLDTTASIRTTFVGKSLHLTKLRVNSTGEITVPSASKHVLPRGNDSNVLETTLIGEPNSVFSKVYPIGINISERYNEFFNRLMRGNGHGITSITLDILLPDILIHFCPKNYTMFDKKSLSISVLMDETYDVYVVKWNEKI